MSRKEIRAAELTADHLGRTARPRRYRRGLSSVKSDRRSVRHSPLEVTGISLDRLALYTYPSNDDTDIALQNVSPEAHKAVLIGGG